MSKLTDTRIRKQRTWEEMHDALKRFCNAVSGNSGANERACFSIPADDGDADIILNDAIDELMEARKKIIELEIYIQSLRRSE